MVKVLGDRGRSPHALLRTGILYTGQKSQKKDLTLDAKQRRLIIFLQW